MMSESRLPAGVFGWTSLVTGQKVTVLMLGYIRSSLVPDSAWVDLEPSVIGESQALKSEVTVLGLGAARADRGPGSTEASQAQGTTGLGLTSRFTGS